MWVLWLLTCRCQLPSEQSAASAQGWPHGLPTNGAAPGERPLGSQVVGANNARVTALGADVRQVLHPQGAAGWQQLLSMAANVERYL